ESIDALMEQLENRERQLNVLEGLLLENELAVEMSPAGRPVAKGWISSRYGSRRDPVSGKKSFHRGLDFAGKRGADVSAMAAGVVTYSGRKNNYGNIVIIDHGNGYVTRYAHNKENLVSAGDAVKRGQIIAKLGSTGRSTGPHVHLEVLKDGKFINPIKLVRAEN
ncbi:MAG: M23 family metallopeptidase, partial [Gammaproteobacteria bacterium]